MTTSYELWRHVVGDVNKIPTRNKDGNFVMEKSHKQHIIIVVLNDRCFKREKKDESERFSKPSDQ
jgi:hypothetical protein